VYTLFEDTRPIVRLMPQAEGLDSYSVGRNGVTKIEAYAEAGDRGYQPAYAVWVGDKMIRRIIGGAWTVCYDS